MRLRGSLVAAWLQGDMRHALEVYLSDRLVNWKGRYRSGLV